MNIDSSCIAQDSKNNGKYKERFAITRGLFNIWVCLKKIDPKNGNWLEMVWVTLLNLSYKLVAGDP